VKRARWVDDMTRSWPPDPPEVIMRGQEDTIEVTQEVISEVAVVAKEGL
jgi:hypothetical protein